MLQYILEAAPQACPGHDLSQRGPVHQVCAWLLLETPEDLRQVHSRSALRASNGNGVLHVHWPDLHEARNLQVAARHKIHVDLVAIPHHLPEVLRVDEKLVDGSLRLRGKAGAAVHVDHW